MGSGNQSFTNAYLAQVICPGNAKPLSGEHAGEPKIQKWILRHRKAHAGREHGASRDRDQNAGDEMRGFGVPRFVLSQARLHRMGHQNRHVSGAVTDTCADADGL